MNRPFFGRRAHALIRCSYPIDKSSYFPVRTKDITVDDLIDGGHSCVIEQPVNRGTGIAIITALLHLLQRDADAVVAFFPCDHFYADDDSFRLTIRCAVECAEQNSESIILVGAEPSIPRSIMDGLSLA